MTVHVFPYEDWYRDDRLDGWDCDYHYLVIGDGEPKLLTANSQYWESKMREAYPDRVEHDFTISRHRGHLEVTERTEWLRHTWPDIWRQVNDWCSFQDRRTRIG